MSEFNTPIVNNKLLANNLITNATTGSIMIQLYDTNTSNGETREMFRNFSPGESVFYQDIVETNPTSGFYNKPKIGRYVANKILSNLVVTPTLPKIELLGLTGSTGICTVGTSDTITKTPIASSQSHLDIYSALDVNNKIKIIVYKDLASFSYTLNQGQSVISIPNTGLLYPTEVTSVAVQTYHNGNSSTGVPKIWVGTLREGLKSFTIGNTSWDVDGSDEYIFSPELITDGTRQYVPGKKYYANEFDTEGTNWFTSSPESAILPVSYLFRRDSQNVTGVTSTAIQGASISNALLSHSPGELEPCFVVCVSNAPIDAGNPILVYVRKHIFNNTTGAMQAEYVTTTRYMFKYLATTYTMYTKNDLYNIYQRTPVSSYKDVPRRSWTIVTKENTVLPTDGAVLPDIFDVIKTIPANLSHDHTSQTKQLIAIVAPKNNIPIVNILEVSASPRVINTSDTSQSRERKLSISLVRGVGEDVIAIPSYRFSGMSLFYRDNIEELFITEKTKIWRRTNGTWYTENGFVSPWISSEDTRDRNFRLNSKFAFTVTDSVTYLSGLQGFSLMRSPSDGDTFGILNSDLGFVSMKFSNTVIDPLTVQPSYTKIRSDLFGSSVTGMEYLPETNELIFCGLKNTPIMGYQVANDDFDMPKRYIGYDVNYFSTLPVTLQNKITVPVIYKNYICNGDTSQIAHNKSNYIEAEANNNYNSDQLYDTTIFSPNVRMLKELTGTISYPTNPNVFSFLLPAETIATTLDTMPFYQYIANTMKYNRLKLLFRVTDHPVIEAISSSFLAPTSLTNDLILPYLPEKTSLVLDPVTISIVAAGNNRISLTSNISAAHGVSGDVESTTSLLSESTGIFEEAIVIPDTTVTITIIPAVENTIAGIMSDAVYSQTTVSHRQGLHSIELRDGPAVLVHYIVDPGTISADFQGTLYIGITDGTDYTISQDIEGVTSWLFVASNSNFIFADYKSGRGSGDKLNIYRVTNDGNEYATSAKLFASDPSGGLPIFMTAFNENELGIVVSSEASPVFSKIDLATGFETGWTELNTIGTGLGYYDTGLFFNNNNIFGNRQICYWRSRISSSDSSNIVINTGVWNGTNIEIRTINTSLPGYTGTAFISNPISNDTNSYILIHHASDNKMYLYDTTGIIAEFSTILDIVPYRDTSINMYFDTDGLVAVLNTITGTITKWVDPDWVQLLATPEPHDHIAYPEYYKTTNNILLSYEGNTYMDPGTVHVISNLGIDNLGNIHIAIGDPV